MNPLKIIACIFILGITSCKKNKETAPIPNKPATTNPTVEDHNMHETAMDYEWLPSSEIIIQLNQLMVSTSNAKNVIINGSKIKIVAPGNYKISGNLTNGQLVVDDESFGIVRLILDNTNITNNTASAIYIKNAKKVIVFAKEGTSNTFADGTSYVFEDVTNQEPNGTIFSKEDLSFAGTGKITVKGNFSDGISSNDGLIFKNGNIDIIAKDDAIRGKDYVIFRDGTYKITASQDAIKASEETDVKLGYAIIDNGNYTIEAGDDGLHAETEFTINGGNITVVKSREGLEGKQININGGNINITSTDDGINCADGSDPRPGTITNGLLVTIKAGTVFVNAQGDGLDSNGNIEMNGGDIVIHGPSANGNAAIDYDGVFNISKGNIVAVGSKGMAQIPGINSTQSSLLLKFSVAKAAQSVIRIQKSDGTEIITLKSLKSFDSIALSSPLLSPGEYDIFVGGSSENTLASGIMEGKYINGTKLTTFTILGKTTNLTIPK